MSLKKLIETIYTGGDNQIGFVKMSDVNKFDNDNKITRALTNGFPSTYVIRDSSSLSFFSGLKSGTKNLVHFTKDMTKVDFGFDVGLIKRAMAIFTKLGIKEEDIVFKFPEKNAPLVLTAKRSKSRAVGLDWGILIVSYDLVD